MRKPGFHLKSGYVVLAVPDSGLFVKDGKIISGHGTEMKFDEVVLFSRRAHADAHAKQNQTYWENGDPQGHQWKFQVLPVLVSERL